MNEPRDHKEALQRLIAAARSELSRETAGLRASASPAAIAREKLGAAVGENRWLWLGGAGAAGLLITRIFRRGKNTAPRRGGGLLGWAMRTALSAAKPVLLPIIVKQAAQWFAAKRQATNDK